MARKALLRPALALVACVAAAAPAGAQRRSAPRVTAQLSTGVVKVGQRTAIVLEAENVDRAKLVSIPEVEDLLVGPASAPSRQSFTSIQGRRAITVQSVRWSVPLRALREGEFEIPPFVLDVDGDRMATRPLRLKVVADMAGADLGFLEVAALPARVVEGQPFSIEIRFGWDQSMRNLNFGDLSLTWWGDAAGVLELERDFPPPGARSGQIVVNSEEVVAVEELETLDVHGRPYRSFRLVRTLLPTRSGLLEFPTSFLEFGELRESRDWFGFSGRTERVKSYFVRAPTFFVEVVPLPETGQPYDFTGAVGRISARASADVRDVDVGDSIKLTVEWTGEGNLEYFDAPDPGRMDAFAAFRVYGSAEEKDFERRVVVYDLAPMRADVEAIPPLPLVVFDVGREEYVTVETQPIPIRVRPLEGAVELDGPAEPSYGRDIRDIDTTPPGTGEPGAEAPPSDGLVIGLLLGVPVVWLGVRTAVRRRSGDPDAPLARRRRGARRELARRLARASTPREELDALFAFLSARSREPEQAWVGRDVSVWLARRAARGGGAGAGMEDEARELAGLIRRLERAIYARSGGGPGKDEILRVADRVLGGGL